MSKFYLAEVEGNWIGKVLGPYTQADLNKKIQVMKDSYKSYLVMDTDMVQVPQSSLRADFQKLIEAFVEDPRYDNARRMFKFLRNVDNNVFEGWGNRRIELLGCAGRNDECTNCSYTTTAPTILTTLKAAVDQLGKNYSGTSFDNHWSPQEYEYDEADQYRPPIRYCPVAIVAKVAKLINLTKVSKDRLGVLVPTMLMLLPVLADAPYSMVVKKTRKSKN